MASLGQGIAALGTAVQVLIRHWWETYILCSSAAETLCIPTAAASRERVSNPTFFDQMLPYKHFKSISNQTQNPPAAILRLHVLRFCWYAVKGARLASDEK